jgi:hypothetical protein
VGGTDTPEKPSAAARRMWYDSVAHGHVPALRCAIDSFGAGRLLLGTDFPYEAGDIFVRAVDYITDPRITKNEAPRRRFHSGGGDPIGCAPALEPAGYRP